MRTRWRILFCCSLGTLIGVTWLASRFHTSLWSWVNLQMLGMIVASAVAFGAMVKESRDRRLAAAALVCAAPMAQALYRSISILPDLLRVTGAPGLLMLAGSAGTIGVAIYILVKQPPPPPDDRIPRARSTPARS